MDFTVKTPADHRMGIYVHGKSEGASTRRIEPPAKVEKAETRPS